MADKVEGVFVKQFRYESRGDGVDSGMDVTLGVPGINPLTREMVFHEVGPLTLGQVEAYGFVLPDIVADINLQTSAKLDLANSSIASLQNHGAAIEALRDEAVKKHADAQNHIALLRLRAEENSHALALAKAQHSDLTEKHEALKARIAQIAATAADVNQS